MVSGGAAADARDSIRTIFKEVSKFGLTLADVTRAVFRAPLEDLTNGCNCPTCRSSSSMLGLLESLPKDEVGNQSPVAPPRQ